MEAAKNGFVTEEMKIVAKKENVSCEYLLEKMACGEIVIPTKTTNQFLLKVLGLDLGLRSMLTLEFLRT